MLSRLRRMAGFESQNFDPVVQLTAPCIMHCLLLSNPGCTSLSCTAVCRKMMWSESFRYTVQRVTMLLLRHGDGS